MEDEARRHRPESKVAAHPWDTLECTVEQHLVKQVERLGGKAIKFTAIGFRGLPDRICFLPTGLLLLVELKRPKGGRLSTVQRRVHGFFARLGFMVYRVHTRQMVNELIDIAERRIHALSQ